MFVLIEGTRASKPPETHPKEEIALKLCLLTQIVLNAETGGDASLAICTSAEVIHLRRGSRRT